MANIIYNVRFRKTEYSKSNNNSKRGKTDLKKMYDYYNRDEACDKTIDTGKAFDYYDYRLGSQGGWTNGNKSIDSEQAYKLAQEYQPKMIYQTVLSFEKDFAIQNNIIEKKDMQKLVSKSMDGILSQFDLKPDNVVWTAFYHTNTEHPHCHISFYEKVPTKKTFLVGKNKINKIRGQVVSQMEINLNLYIKKDRTFSDLIDAIQKMGLGKDVEENLIKSFNRSVKKNNHVDSLAKKLIALDDRLPKEGSFKYNSKNIRPYHEDIKMVIQDILQDESVKPLYDSYINVLNETKEIQLNLYGDGTEEYKNGNGEITTGSGKGQDDIEKYYEKQLDTLETRIANMILQTILNARKDYDDALKVYMDDSISTNPKIVKTKEEYKITKEPVETTKIKIQTKKQRKRIPKKMIRKRIYLTRASNLLHGSNYEINRAINNGYYANIALKQQVQEATRVAQEQISAMQEYKY